MDPMDRHYPARILSGMDSMEATFATLTALALAVFGAGLFFYCGGAT